MLAVALLLARASVEMHQDPLQVRQDANESAPVTIGNYTHTVAPSFVAHGWEPWMATQAFHLFNDPAVVAAFGHLRGQTIRFGGITADWLDYVVDDAVSAPCFWGRQGRAPFTPGGACPFSTGALDAVLRLMEDAGIGLLFDLNVLVGRNCTQPEPYGPRPTQDPTGAAVGKGVPNEWCGDTPAPWNTSSVRVLLEHIRGNSNRSGTLTPSRFVGFELGNELFAPQHVTHEVANADIATAAELLKSVWSAPSSAPRLFGTGTNDCHRRNNSDSLAALFPAKLGMESGFSWHSYPGNAQTDWNKSDLTSFLLNASWLRNNIVSWTEPCLLAWNSGPRAAGVLAAVTEAAAMCGPQDIIPPGAPTTSSFIHGFFSIAQLGQFARKGISLLARWGIPQLLGLDFRSLGPAAPWNPTLVSADLFLYVIYNRTVGRRVLDVSGDELSDALVYAHCTSGVHSSNGSVTLAVVNPSPNTVTLSIALPTLPRLEYIFTAPKGNLSSHFPVLNNNTARPLRLAADGSLPPMPGVYCGSPGGCPDAITLPPQSYAFFVLLSAHADVACGSELI